MPRQRPQTRAPHDRIIELADTEPLTGYRPETLRKKVRAGAVNPPPLFKYHGRWCAWLTDLEQWVAEQQQPVGRAS
jgi:hypothetical protein